MGNRAIRRELAASLRNRKLGKLYLGGRKRALTYLSSMRMQELLFQYRVVPGQLVHDCDGFNHVVKTISYGRNYLGILNIDLIEFDDGSTACGCPYGPYPAETPKQIEDFFRLAVCSEKEEKVANGWWTNRYEALFNALASNKPISDSIGQQLAEFKNVSMDPWRPYCGS